MCIRDSGQTSLPGWPVADTTLHVDVFGSTWFLLTLPGSGTPGAAGEGGFTIPFAVGANLLGNAWYHQAFTVDLGDPELVTASNGLELIYGS